MQVCLSFSVCIRHSNFLVKDTEDKDKLCCYRLLKNSTFISSKDLIIRSALVRFCLPEFGFKKPMHFIPAAFAAVTPFAESSITTHSSGLLFASSAAFKKISGWGFD